MPQLILSIQGVEIKRVNLVKNRTTLGRKPGNDIVVNDMVVSGEHCAFDLRGLADVYVEDLNSTNGTYLNGKMLHGERPQLVDHDVISVGRIRILFLSASDPGDFGQTTAMSLEGTGLQGGTEAQERQPACPVGFLGRTGSSGGQGGDDLWQAGHCHRGHFAPAPGLLCGSHGGRL